MLRAKGTGGRGGAGGGIRVSPPPHEILLLAVRGNACKTGSGAGEGLRTEDERVQQSTAADPRLNEAGSLGCPLRKTRPAMTPLFLRPASTSSSVVLPAPGTPMSAVILHSPPPIIRRTCARRAHQRQHAPWAREPADAVQQRALAAAEVALQLHRVLDAIEGDGHGLKGQHGAHGHLGSASGGGSSHS